MHIPPIHEIQAIIDGASITLPHGTLTECYDELGSRYQLPVYCLSSPTNLVRENSDGDDGDGDGEVKADGDKFQEDCGVEMPLKLRLSTGEEVKVRPHWALYIDDLFQFSGKLSFMSSNVIRMAIFFAAFTGQHSF